LFDAADLLHTKATLLSAAGEGFGESRRTILIEDPTDNLILHCVLAHARQHPSELKAFLSGNSRDFGMSAVRGALDQAGVKYLTKTEDFLGWYGSLPDSPITPM
jgi:hypothetical protein